MYLKRGHLMKKINPNEPPVDSCEKEIAINESKLVSCQVFKIEATHDAHYTNDLGDKKRCHSCLFYMQLLRGG